MCRCIFLVLVCVSIAVPAMCQPPVDLLPDVIVNSLWLFDRRVVDDVVPGRIHLRFSNGTPNIGDGKLYIHDMGGGARDEGEPQVAPVYQRVFRTDGSFFDLEAGHFVFHPTHNHIHLEDWAIYRLREVTPGNGVGGIVVEGDKTSFCLLDSRIYNPFLPNFAPIPEFLQCGLGFQGISVGYEDVYLKNLPDQWLDITDVPNGTYWLESEVDPVNHILESNEANNITRVQLVIAKPVSMPLFPGWIGAALLIGALGGIALRHVVYAAR